MGRQPGEWDQRRRRASRTAAALGAALLAGMLSARSAGAAGAGALDPAFGHSGIARLALGGQALPAALSTDAQGRVLIAGRAGVGGTIETFVARLTAAGAPDTSFGNGGAVLAQLGGQPGMPEGATALAAPAAGDAIVAGITSDGRNFVERLLPGGAVDPLFGTAGVYLTPAPIGTAPASVLERRDGTVVTAGTATDPATGLSAIRLEGLTPTGAADPAFGADGVAVVQLGKRTGNAGATSTASAAALSSDGKIVIAGSATDALGATDGVIARFGAGGALDPSFGLGGVALTGSLRPSGAAVLADGAVLLAGQAPDAAGTPAPALSRYAPTGALDPTFGVRGVLVSDLLTRFGRTSTPGRGGLALGPAVAPDGSIVIDAVPGSGSPASPRILARFAPSGAIDCSFGQAGRASLALPAPLGGDASPVIGGTGDALLAGDLGSGRGAFVAALTPGPRGSTGAASVATGAAARQRKSRVVLEGFIDPGCNRFRYRFEYAPLGSGRLRFTPTRLADVRPGPQAVLATLPRQGMVRGRTYRYRLVLRGAGRTLEGRFRRFAVS